MSRISDIKPHLSFIKGLITEGSTISSPEDIAVDCDNIVIDKKGSIRRRLGVDYEDGYSLTPISVDKELLSTYAITNSITIAQWHNVRNEGDKSYFVVQFGSYLHIFKSYELTVSSNLVGSIDYTTFAVSGNADGARNNPISVESVKGRLIVLNKYCNQFYLEEDEDGVITATGYAIEIRDTVGVDDGLVKTDRTQINDLRRYNLSNAGWPSSFSCWVNNYGSLSVLYNPIDWTFIKMASYPSLTDVFSSFLASSTTVSVSDAFNPYLLNNSYPSTGVVPKGHYIMSIFDQDRSTASGISGVPSTLEESVRFRLVKSYQGRLFYCGLDSSTVESGLYFTQTLFSNDNIGKCHSVNDPTDPDFSDEVDTDGGFIPLHEAGKINSIDLIGNKLIIGAQNGIWSVTGRDGGFRPSNYTVDKLSKINVLNDYSKAVVGDSIMFWGYNGIYNIAPNEYGDLVVKNISVSTIQTIYDNISQNSKRTAQGIYDEVNNVVFWFYSESTDGVQNRNNYTGVLVLDLNINAFFKHSISDLAIDSPFIAGVGATSSSGNTVVPYNIVVGTDEVVVTAQNVIENISVPTAGTATPSLKLLTVVPGATADYSNITFSEFNSRRFVDWFTADGEGADYVSYAVTGWENSGDFSRDKSVKSFTSMFTITEDGYELDGDGNIVNSNQSGCKLTSKWDYANSTASNKYHVINDIYRVNNLYVPADVNDAYDYGYEVTKSTHSIRGSGKALQYKFESIAGKDFELLGWVTEYAINAGY